MALFWNWWKKDDRGDQQVAAPAPQPAGQHPGVWILLGLAAAAIVATGMSAIGAILAPVLLALVLTMCAQPVRTWLVARGAPVGLATAAGAVSVFLLLAGFVYILLTALGQFVTMVPEYASELQGIGDRVGAWFASIGFGPQQVQQIVMSFDPSRFIDFFSGLLGGAFGLVTVAVVILTMLILMASDASLTPTLLRQLQPARPNLVQALRGYSRGVRRYMIVTAMLGVVQGLLNWVALLILGVPAALLWGVLSFLCSFIPNVGYFVAIIPPLLFGYLTGGWGSVIAIVIIYGVINAVVQSIVQPRVVGNAVALNQTLTFFSVLFWAVILGPLGAILAVPLTLLVRAILVDANPAAWTWKPAIGELTETREILRAEHEQRRVERRRARSKNQGT